MTQQTLANRAVTREAAQARMLRASRAMVAAEGKGRTWLNAANRRRHAQKAFLQAGGTWEEVHEVYAQAQAEVKS